MIIPKLTGVRVEICDVLMRIGKLGKALKQLQNRKSPGTDGLTSEIYKFFWPDIKQIVFDSQTYAYENNSLLMKRKWGIIAIIPKKDKDLRWFKNWHPLLLLNTDYKMLTKALASRLQKVIPELVSLDQSGYIKGSYISENIVSIYDIIDCSTK